MEWHRDNKIRLARRIKRVSLDIQQEEFRGSAGGDVKFQELVDRTFRRIMGILEPFGFERANKDWEYEESDHLEHMGGGYNLHLYRDSPTHLWFETAVGRMVKIRKDLAERLLVLELP